MKLDDFERDLRPFADPATDVEVIGSSESYRAKLIRNGANLTITLTTDSENVRVETGDDLEPRHFVNFRSLLASNLFASVKSMAENQRRMLSAISDATFIEPEGQIDADLLSQAAFESASRLKSGQDSASQIYLTLIDGPAGVGKTSLITRLVASRAVKYGSESSEPVILHVANRGRRLASLDDLIALSIQLVRARFTYDQVPALIRNGVIQIAVDGFDELVDSDGYADAWSVLKDFLNDVKSGGPILLAGRDTFFDLSGFREKLGKVGDHTKISHVRLSAITPKAAYDWLVTRGWQEAELKSDEAQDLLKENSYALRPYFLSEVAKLGGMSQLLEELVSPREFLVRKFIDREADLITARVPLTKDNAAKLLRELFELIAIEMAESETEAVDVPFVQLAVEYTFGKALTDPADLAKLRHKAGSFALMDNDARQDFRRFPHTEISNHFLASALLNRIREGAIPRLLRRGYFGSDLMSVIGDALLTLPLESVLEIRKRLVDATKSEIGFERLSENACSLALQSLVVDSIEQTLEISGLSAGEVVLFRTSGPARLHGISISRLDGRSADLTAVSFSDCRVATMLVDETTSFGDQPPKVDHLMVEAEGRQLMIYDPGDISAWIADHGSNRGPAGGLNSDSVALLSKVARIFTRQFYIKDDDTEADGRNLANPLWGPIEAILEEEGRLRRNDRKGASGRKSDFVHVVNANALLLSATEQDRKIWEKVAALN